MDLSAEDAQALLKLVYAGKLFEIQEWITSGKGVDVPSISRKQPFAAALDQGFHSLAVLIARNLSSQSAKNAALGAAVQHRNIEFTTLLLDLGAELQAVPLATVLLTWDQRLMRLFLARDADAITDAPFAKAFVQRVQQALRVFVEYKQDHPELSAQLQAQVDEALHHACAKGDLKWVSLLMWAGANPRSTDEDGNSAMEDASYCEDPAILKRLKPDPRKDNLNALLAHASRFARHKTVAYLLDLGATVNDKPNGGSSALDACLSYLHFADFDAFRYKKPISSYTLWKLNDTLTLLLEHGALWQPDEQELRSLRATLYKAEPELTLELVKRLRTPNTIEMLRALLRPTRMQQHLVGHENQFLHQGIDVRTKEYKAKMEAQAQRHRLYTLQRLAKDYNREQLYEDVWSVPIQQLAQRHNRSDVGLAKLCRKLKIPLPGRGYWAKKAAGKPVDRRPPLPPIA